MKKVIFVRVVILAVGTLLAIHCSFSAKARAGEAIINYQKQAIIFLCDDNAELVQTLDELVGVNIISFRTEIIVFPTSHFYMMIKDMVVAEKKKQDYKEILVELYKDNSKLKLALKERTFKAERIR